MQKGNIMLYLFRTKAEAQTLSDRVPAEVMSHICDVADVLDSCYNSQCADGGYILLAESVQDIEDIQRFHLDYATEPIELMKQIKDYLSILYIPATEYGITIILPKTIAPLKMLKGVNESVQQWKQIYH